MSEPRPSSRFTPALVALGCVIAVMASEGLFSTLSGAPSDFSLFLGRFHPLAVHLPIGIVLLVVTAEALSFSPRFRARVDPAIGLTLPALVGVSLGAFLLGELLARSGDFAPRILNLHRRLELFAVAGICAAFAAWSYQSRSESPRARLVYRVVLGVAVLVMSVGAHFGGIMTRGETYLSRYAPGPLKPLLGGTGEDDSKKEAKHAQAPGAEPQLYANAVAPILKQRCAGCHGSEKTKGGLQLDSLAGIQRGGENGIVVEPGLPDESPLIQAMLLPLDDDAHMPPKAKPQPTPGEIQVLRFWVERGANDKLLLRDAVPPAEALPLLENALRTAPASSAAPTSSGTPASSGPPASSATPASSNTPTSTATDSPASPTPAAPAPAPVSPAPASANPPSPPRSAQAILAAACQSCHGAKKQKAKLRVDSLDALLAGGKSGPAIVPGKPKESELIRRIQLPLSDDEHMPPESEPQLSAGDIQTLTAWVRGLSGHQVASTASSGRAAATSNERATSEPDTATPPESTASDSPAPAAPTAASTAPPTSAAEAAISAESIASLPARVVLFPDAVGPILLDRCGKCHTGQKPARGLRVDDHAALLRGGASGPAIVAGKPDESLLLERVGLPLDDGDHMPPEDQPQLTAGEISILRIWVARGAARAFEMNTRDLPAEAQRAVATRPPKSGNDASDAALASKSGGCGACRVGKAGGAAAGSWAMAASTLLSLVSRRKARVRATSHRPSVPI